MANNTLKNLLAEARQFIGATIIYFWVIIPGYLFLYNDYIVRNTDCDRNDLEKLCSSFILKRCWVIASIAFLIYFGSSRWFNGNNASKQKVDTSKENRGSDMNQEGK